MSKYNIDRKPIEERNEDNYEMDPLSALICESSYAMLSGGAAVPYFDYLDDTDFDLTEDEEHTRK